MYMGGIEEPVHVQIDTDSLDHITTVSMYVRRNASGHLCNVAVC